MALPGVDDWLNRPTATDPHANRRKRMPAYFRQSRNFSAAQASNYYIICIHKTSRIEVGHYLPGLGDHRE
jgi:hypothetical protein